MDGIKVVFDPKTRTYVIRQSYSLPGILILVFATFGTLVLFSPEALKGHPVALWVARVLFSIGPGILGFSMVTRRMETVLDCQARTFSHLESWMGSPQRSSGTFDEIESLNLKVKIYRGPSTRSNPPNRTTVLELVFRGAKLPIFDVNERLSRLIGGKCKGSPFPAELGGEEFARRISDETGLFLKQDLPRFYR